MKSDRILRHIEDNYGIQVIAYKVIPRLMFRESLMFESAQNQFVVKKYPVTMKTADLKKMLKLYEELERCGVVTNKVVYPIKGDPIFEFPDGKYVVFTFVLGKSVAMEDISNKLLSEIDEVHEKIKDVCIPLYAASDPFEEKRIEEWAWEEVDDFTQEINKYVSLFQEIEGDFIQTFKDRQPMIIHGDCTLNNLVTFNGRFFLIDFDNYRVGFREEDIANLLNSILYSSVDIETKKLYVQCVFQYYCASKAEENYITKLQICMQKNAIEELYKHKQNYRYLKRNPGTSRYLQSLLKIICEVERMK